MSSEGLPALNANWVQIAAIVSAAIMAFSAARVKRRKGNPEWAAPTEIFMDLMRGAAVFPLLLMISSGFFPDLGILALKSEPVLFSLAACYALLAVLQDYRKNL